MKTDNEIIAEFMKFNVTSERTLVDATIERVWKANEYPYFGGFRTEQLSQFETSWDWLMPVVEKIENTPVIERPGSEYIFTIDKGICIISEDGENPVIECQRFDTRIENTYRCIVNFIKWHNEVKRLTK